MSRKELRNKEWMIAFGADHHCGSYFQVWQMPDDEQDSCIVEIDNMGIQNEINNSIIMPVNFLVELTNVEKRFQIARRNGNLHPNIDAMTIVRLANTLGFNDPHLAIDVYHELD